MTPTTSQPLGRMSRVVGHRGAAGLAPENTLVGRAAARLVEFLKGTEPMAGGLLVSSFSEAALEVCGQHLSGVALWVRRHYISKNLNKDAKGTPETWRHLN